MAAATPRSKTEAGPGFQGQVWLLRYETVVSGHCSTEKRLLPRCRVVMCRCAGHRWAVLLSVEGVCTGRHNIDWLQLLAPYLLFPSQPNSEEGSMLCKATTVLFSPRRVPPRIVAPAPDLRTQPAQDWTWPPPSHTPSRPDDADIHSRPRHPQDASLVSRRMSFCQPWSHPGTKSLSGSRHPSGSSVDNPHRHLNSSLNPYHLTIPGLLVVYTGTCTARFHLAGEALLGPFKDTGR